LTLEDVVEAVDALGGLRFWLDGGWGVDALLGEQTREHSDLDAAIDREDLADADRRLRRLAYERSQEVDPEDPARYVMRNARGCQIDFHVLAFDSSGHGWQTLANGQRHRYPAADLTASGRIGERTVPCISAALQLRHHSSYEPTGRDRIDMRRLASRFGLELPDSLQIRA
jgi:lincosamide nucleotidyltransferase A/C/D/E